MRQLSFVAFAICTAGCYYYRPLATPEPAPGSFLSATLTDTGADHLSRSIGPDVRSVRGRLLRSDPSALTFSVAAVTLHHGENVTWRGEPVTLSREYVVSLEERRLAKGRTLLIAAAALVAVVTTYKVAEGVGLIPTNTSGNPPPK
jgi:hypothetical protein